MILAGIAAWPLQRGEGGGGDDRRARAVSGWASESGRCASRRGAADGWATLVRESERAQELIARAGGESVEGAARAGPRRCGSVRRVRGERAGLLG